MSRHEPGPYLDARQAAELLGVRRETLYAYVSRGLVRSQEVPGSRRRRYHREDLERLRRRKEVRRTGEPDLDEALFFGQPLLESAITLIENGRLYYRGHDALGLADRWSFEEVAAEMWQLGEDDSVGRIEAAELFAHDDTVALPSRAGELLAHLGDLAPLERAQVLLPRLAVDDVAAWAPRPDAVLRTGARLIRWLTLIAADGPWQGDVVTTLARGWHCDDEPARRLLSAALVLCLDHELNVSAFTARCVASAGSPLHAVVAAALGALQGRRHGGHTRRVEALLREAGGARNIERTIADRLRRGETIPGFGQPLYPDGDPRAEDLLRRVESGWPDSGAAAEGRALVRAGATLLDRHPTLDVGLVITSRALALPEDAGLTLFALGRSAGWIAHAIEQYAQNRLIRPRARYVGPLPV